MKAFLYKLPPEVSGEVHEWVVRLIAVQEMMKVCLRDREEYWLQRSIDERIKSDAFHEKIVRQYHNPDDFNVDESVVIPIVHWLTNILEIRVDDNRWKKGEDEK